MRPYEAKVIDMVRFRAKTTESQDLEAIRQLLDPCGCAGMAPEVLAARLFSTCPITLNFHPDRLSNNGRWILQNILDEGQYKSQFQTGTTNGGRTAFPGGERDLWEKRLFMGGYHQEETANHRPKYGAVNVFCYADGASARFGSCFFALNQRAVSRCTFAFGDSSSSPEALGTRDAFAAVLRALFMEIHTTGCFLNRMDYTLDTAIDWIMAPEKESAIGIGRNLDHCIEAHVHGDVSLADDVQSLSIDQSFQGTKTEAIARALAMQYGLSLYWIPERKLHITQIGPDFRGPMIPPLAERIIEKFGITSGILNAEIIGRASRNVVENLQSWRDLGDEPTLFQSIKQLWHTLAFYG